MRKKLEEFKTRLKKEHHDIIMYVEHTFDALDKVEEEHRKLVANNSLAGIKPVGEAEHTFYEALREVRETLVQQLELTVQDFEHVGDKNWSKNFKSIN